MGKRLVFRVPHGGKRLSCIVYEKSMFGRSFDLVDDWGDMGRVLRGAHVGERIGDGVAALVQRD